MSRRGLGDGIVGAAVIANAVNQTAGRKTKVLWRMCGWSVVVVLTSVFPIACWSFSPALGVFGLSVALVGFVSFLITLFIGMLLLVFRL